MRFSDRITFVSIPESYYDPKENKYIEGKPINDTMPCKLSKLSMERTQQLFGTLDRNVTIARLQRPYNKEFDYVEINDKKYTVTGTSDYRKGVFYLVGEFK